MKRVLFGIILIVGMLVLPFGIQKVRANPGTWTVDDDGPADFQTIKEAVVAANEIGDTIYVRNGTYHENIRIFHKSLMLIGENKYGTIIDAVGPLAYAISVEYAQGVTITGFTIRNAETGIIVYGACNNTIVGNVITNGSFADPYNWGGGISIGSSTNNTVADNTISNTTVVGIFMGQYSYRNIIVNNVISRNTEIELNDSHGVFFGDRSYQNIVRNNVISKFHRGIYAAQLAYNNTIVGNTISDLTIYECGINIWGPNNTIIGNTIKNMGYVGIQLNSISSDGNYGVPNACANNVIRGNAISNSTFGINLILAAFSNTVVENNVSDNSLGVLISDHSDNNTVTNNLVSNNDYGILIFSSNNTKVYHNSFVNNTAQTSIWDSFGTMWDNGYPSGGNCWSDYSGADDFHGPNQDILGSDNKGDWPYYVDGDNVDHYPLINMWSPPTILSAGVCIKLDSAHSEEWIDAFIELPENLSLDMIETSTVVLNGTIQAEQVATVGDYDNDSIPDLRVEFNRTAITQFVLSQGIIAGNVTFIITGSLYDGTLFVATGTMWVRMPGDVNIDGKVDIRDISVAANAFGCCLGESRWNGAADENEDCKINIRDIALIAKHFGDHYP